MGKNIEEINESSIEEQEANAKKAEDTLIDKTAERLAAIPGLQNDDAAEDDTTEDDDDGTDSTDDDDKGGTEDDSSTSQSDDDDTTEDDDDGTDSTDDDDKGGTEDDSSTSQSDDNKDGKVKIPDAYYRAAIHQEWKPKEIAEFYKSNPELAERTFAKIYESVNKSSTEFATLGRLKLQQTQEIEKAKLEKSQEKDIDINGLRENYENSDEVINIVEELQKQNKMLREQKAASPAQHSDQALDQDIDTFFAADDLKLYDDFYGPGKDADGKIVPPEQLTPGQKANRHAVLVFADSLITGNAYKGYDMPVVEALELAHLNVSQPLQKQKIREEIMGKVVKRSKSITLTGSGKTKVTSTTKSGKPSKDDLIAKTEKRLANIFNK